MSGEVVGVGLGREEPVESHRARCPSSVEDIEVPERLRPVFTTDLDLMLASDNRRGVRIVIGVVPPGVPLRAGIPESRVVADTETGRAGVRRRQARYGENLGAVPRVEPAAKPEGAREAECEMVQQGRADDAVPVRPHALEVPSARETVVQRRIPAEAADRRRNRVKVPPVRPGELVAVVDLLVDPVHEMVFVGRRLRAREEVVEERAGIRGRHERGHLPRQGIMAARRDHVVRERIANESTHSVIARGGGIEDHDVQFRNEPREVAGTEGGGRQRQQRGRTRAAAPKTRIVEEEERAVLDDRSANGGAELVLPRRSPRAGEEPAGVQFLIAQELESVPVVVVRSRLDLVVRDSEAAAQLGRIQRARNLELFDRLERRRKGGEPAWHLRVREGDAVYHGYLRQVWTAVIGLREGVPGNAGRQENEVLGLPAAILHLQWEVHHDALFHVRADLGGLHHRDGRDRLGNRDLLHQLADFHGDVQRRCGGCENLKVFRHIGLEAVQRRFEAVRAHRNVHHDVVSGAAALGGGRKVRFEVSDLDGHTGHDGAGCIGNDPSHAAGGDLRRSAGGHEKDQAQCDTSLNHSRDFSSIAFH